MQAEYNGETYTFYTALTADAKDVQIYDETDTEVSEAFSIEQEQWIIAKMTKPEWKKGTEEIQNETMGPQSNVNVTEDGLVVLGFAGSDCRHVLQKSDAIDLAEQLMIALGAPVELVEQLMSALKLNEAYSEKQRKWACAQTGDSRKNFKGKPSLTKKEADEMCKDVELKGKKK